MRELTVYEVKVSTRWQQTKNGKRQAVSDPWEEESEIWVLSSIDGAHAIEKAKKYWMGKIRKYSNDDGKCVDTVVDVRVMSMKLEGTIDIR